MRRSAVLAAALLALVLPVRRGVAGKGPLEPDFGGFGDEWEFDPWDSSEPPDDLPIPDVPDPPLPDSWEDPSDIPPPPPIDDFDFPAIPDVSGDEPLGYKKPAPAPIRRRYLAFRAKSKDLGYGYLPYARALWAPFRWETSAGIPSAAQLDAVSHGTFGTELVTGDDAYDSYSLQASAVSGGLRVTAQAPSGLVGTHDFAGAHAVDLAVEHDGTDLIFLARAEGTTTTVEIGRTAFAPTQPLYPALSAYAMASPAVVGFDRFRVAKCAKAPDSDAGAPASVEKIYDAFDVQLAMLHHLDGAAPNLTSVRAWLAVAQARYALATAASPKSAKKKIAAAAKQGAAVLTDLDKQKPVQTVFKALLKTLTLDLAARKALAAK